MWPGGGPPPPRPRAGGGGGGPRRDGAARRPPRRPPPRRPPRGGGGGGARGAPAKTKPYTRRETPGRSSLTKRLGCRSEDTHPAGFGRGGAIGELEGIDGDPAVVAGLVEAGEQFAPVRPP